MKKLGIAVATALFVVSCSSNTEDDKPETQFLDLSTAEHSELIDNYWVVSRNAVSPQYPVSAARDGVSGCVEVVVAIGSDGRAEGYEVRSSFPKGVFDDYAVAALRKWRWKAAEENTERTPVLTTVELDFTVQGAPDDPEYLENCSSMEQAEQSI